MIFQRGETVTRLRAELVVDRRTQNKTERDWANADPLDIDGWAIAPRYTADPVEAGRTQRITGFVIYGPYGADITADDRVKCRGRVCEVDGEPGPWRDPYGGDEFGVEIYLKGVRG